MKKSVISVVLLLALTFVSGCKTIPDIRGIDDPLERTVTIQHGSPATYLIGGSQDYFLRGSIDKATKAISYQLYFVFNSGYEPRLWSTMKFLGKKGLEEYKTIPIAANAKTYGPTVIGTAVVGGYSTIVYEHVAITLNKETMEYLASNKTKVRFDSRRFDESRDEAIDPKRVRAFLDKVDKASKMMN